MPSELHSKQSFQTVFYGFTIICGLILAFGAIFTAEDILSVDNAVGLICMLLSEVAIYHYAERWFKLQMPKVDEKTLSSYLYLKDYNDLWADLDMGIMFGIFTLTCVWILTFFQVNILYDEMYGLWWMYLFFIGLTLLSLYGCISLLLSARQKLQEL